ncbi:sigma factor [Microcoleus sp. LEGE 07076]|uniref:sigma factor n=1 Tax=Microcoleus sp. LEGE 07076 TaxID=915322 RepID=UPI001D14DBD6|nr:sigma factor [Microcoleus sp. LEGE 07076]
MNDIAIQRVSELVDRLYRTESRRIFATLIRLLGDFDLAQEAQQEAFAAAVTQWTRDGLPANPRSWLVSTGRFKAIDVIVFVKVRLKFARSSNLRACRNYKQKGDRSTFCSISRADRHQGEIGRVFLKKVCWRCRSRQPLFD